MQKFQKPIAIITLVSVALFAFQPIIESAQAQATPPTIAPQGIGDILVGGISCVSGGLLSQWLVNKIQDGIEWAIKKLPNVVQSFLGFDITDPLASFFPDSVPVKDAPLITEITTKEKILDLSARCFAREILSDLTGRMIGAARTSGREGGPAFVRDWRRFLARAQYRGENLFRSILLSTTLCNDFSNEIRTVFRAVNQPSIGSYQYARVGNLDPFAFRARCTMPQGWTLANYTNDFVGNGGWDALVRLAEPQNNFYGALLLSMGELAAQRAIEEKSDETEGVANNAFTSRRGRAGDSCVIRSYNGQCIIYKDILTPGSVLQQTVAATVQEELNWITNVDEWEELISYLMTTVMSRILNLSQPSNYDQEPFPSELYPGEYTNPWDIGSSPPTGSPQCSDGIDNDNDGVIDLNDPGCTDSSDNDETNLGTVTMTGYVYFDANQNGVRDSSEIGFANYPVQIRNLSTNLTINGTTTDTSGFYNVNEPQIQTNIGIYVLLQNSQYQHTTPGCAPTANECLVSVSSNTNNSVDFGLYTASSGPPSPAITNCTDGSTDPSATSASCLTGQYWPTGPSTDPACGVGPCVVLNYKLNGANLSGGLSSGWAVIMRGGNNLFGILNSALPVGTRVDRMFPAGNVVYSLHDGTNGNEIAKITLNIPQEAQPPPSGAITYSINLQANNGQYLVTLDSNNDLIYEVYANSNVTQQFTLIDRNGGLLQSGDVVNILTGLPSSGGLYFVPKGGGGSILLVAGTTYFDFADFTILKSGGGQITNGDQVSFRTISGSHYVVAENGGGGIVNANRTSIGPWETFVFNEQSSGGGGGSLTCDQPIYRYFSGNGDHYQPNFLDANALALGYVYEGVSFNVSSTQVQGSVPLYMCLSPDRKNDGTNVSNHFMSRNSNCEGNIVEGIAGYVMANPATGANTAINRWHRSSIPDHITEEEDLSSTGYINEGPQGYVCP